MKKLLTVFLSFCFLTVHAQDVIVKQDGNTILSKVVEIGSTEIKYKKWDNLEGPTYTISIKEIQALNYQNGTRETFENQQVAMPSKSTTGFLELQPGIGISDGNKGELGFKIGFLTKASDNIRWGLGAGAQALHYKFSETPIVPVFARFEYQADNNGKGAFFAHLDAGYAFNFDDLDHSAIHLNPTFGSYFGNTYVGIGYIGTIPTKGGSDADHGINITIGLRFGNPIAKANINKKHRTGMKRFLSRTKAALSIGGAVGTTKVSYSEYDDNYESTIGSGLRADFAWTYMFNDHFALGPGIGIRGYKVIDYMKYDGFTTTTDYAMPLFARVEYTFFDKDKSFRPFVRADVGTLLSVGNRDYGFYLQPQAGIKYKKWFASVGLERANIRLNAL